VGAESYCQEVEAYLCRRNHGHLVRVVGPAFEVVSRWESAGVPLKIAFSGIDRSVERYTRKGPRRRPLRVEFCEADVLDAFDEWRRAIGLPAARGDIPERAAPAGDAPAGTASEAASDEDRRSRRGPSLPAHLERALLRLTNARATGSLGAAADDLLDRVGRELECVRSAGHGLRGDARRAVLERLAAIDAELLAVGRASLDEEERQAVARMADEEMRPFRHRMPEGALGRVLEAAADRLVRERLDLPTLTFP
jgi:hypothetical protein